MNHHHTVEIAALISAQSADLLHSDHRLPPGKIERFWDRSKRRVNLWLSALTQYEQQNRESEFPSEVWQDVEPVLQEIFVSEILTRVWGAILIAKDQELGSHEYEPIARHVLLGHLDVRRRALKILVSDNVAQLDQLQSIDRLRRRVERWNDLLLGHLVERYPIQDFTFDPIRSLEFGTQQLLQSTEQSRVQAWTLLLTGLRMAFPVNQAFIAPPNELLQHEIISVILACYPEHAFSSKGPFQQVLSGYRLHSAQLNSSRRKPLGNGSDASSSALAFANELHEPLDSSIIDPISFFRFRNKFGGMN